MAKTLIALDRDPSYAPCCLFICRVTNPEAGEGHYDWDTRDDQNTVLVQTDNDYPSIAAAFGWNCPGAEDSPEDVDCQHNACGADTDGHMGVLDCARAFIDDCIDHCRVVEDPGYFDERPWREDSAVLESLFAVADSDDELRTEWYDVTENTPEKSVKVVERLKCLTPAEWRAFEDALGAYVDDHVDAGLFDAIDAVLAAWEEVDNAA